MSTLKAARRMSGWRRWRDALSYDLTHSDRIPLLGLCVLAVLLVLGGMRWPDLVPQMAMLLPMFLATLWLSPRRLPWFVIACLVGVFVLLATQPEVSSRTVVRVIITFGIGLIILTSSLRRSRLGVSGARSESVFVDLRDRINAQGRIPDLGPQWQVESEVRSAGGTAFAGDFVVASSDDEAMTCDVVVVDVSGKGVDAGSRALLLSGAFGGVLSAVPPEEFLPCANSYLMRQDWDEGFATAIHLHLDRGTGDFVVRKAGHPAGIHLRAGSGSWQVMESEGPVLGLLDDMRFDAVSGRLEPGDAIMLYTDGMVESSERDIGSGIDWLAGRGVGLFRDGFAGGVRRVVRETHGSDDDRALVIVHRL